MTSTARRTSASECVLPAAAAAHAYRVLAGPARPGVVIQTYRSTVLIEVPADRTGPPGTTLDGDGRGDAELLAVTGPSATATPMGIAVSDLSGLTRWVGPVAGAPVTAGDGRLLFGDGTRGLVAIRIRRWWDDRVRPLRGPITASLAQLTHADAGSAVPIDRRDALAAALSGGCAPGPLGSAVDGLIGYGPGLTPAGDDVLAGALVGLRAAGARTDLIAELSARVLARSAVTTRLSGALLRHAAAGRACRELLDLLAGVERGGPVAPAVARVLAIGSTSGADLLAGLLIGLQAAVPRPSRPAPVLTPTSQELR